MRTQGITTNGSTLAGNVHSLAFSTSFNFTPQTTVYCSLPLRLMSRCWGWLAQRPVPETFRPTVYGMYTSTFGVNLDEAVIADLKYV